MAKAPAKPKQSSVAPDPVAPLENIEIGTSVDPAAFDALAETIEDHLHLGDAASGASGVPATTGADLDGAAEDAGAMAPASTDTVDSRPSGEIGGAMIAERIYIISAPAGPRRRAGLGFGPVPVELTWEELGPEPETTLEALRADPMIKIDGRFEERPAESDELGE